MAMTSIPVFAFNVVTTSPRWARNPQKLEKGEHADGLRQLHHPTVVSTSLRPAPFPSTGVVRAFASPPQSVSLHQRPEGCSGSFTSRAVRASASATSSPGTPGSAPVLVVGASGGVGQLVVASLLEKGVPVRTLVRNPKKAKGVFAGAPEGLVDVVVADLRFPEQLKAELVAGVGRVVLATGTTAFPSKRWDGGNGPEQTDLMLYKTACTDMALVSWALLPGAFLSISLLQLSDAALAYLMYASEAWQIM